LFAGTENPLPVNPPAPTVTRLAVHGASVKLSQGSLSRSAKSDHTLNRGSAGQDAVSVIAPEAIEMVAPALGVIDVSVPPRRYVPPDAAVQTPKYG
jgi:hypothetical protein